ncbi:hypothetical protein [Bacillus wiedmannii]|uniref:hypothetical protein n=1 Tax=Bacillus wiedmannii TaxID=1890302 RepID=UPI003D9834A6
MEHQILGGSVYIYLHISLHIFSVTPSLNFKEVLLNGRASCGSASNKVFFSLCEGIGLISSVKFMDLGRFLCEIA